MKKLRKLIIWMVLAVSLLASAVTVPPLASAVTGDISGNGGSLYCRNGPRDYGTFLSSVISYDGFVEYWKDIFERYNGNICVYNDIDNLLKRINKTREQIRQAFYVCDSSAPRLRQTYYELEGELFFLRKFVSFIGDGRVIFRNEKDLHDQYLKYMVEDQHYMTTEDAEALFKKVWKKYEARMDAYVNCADPTWANLIQKWNEFKDHALGGKAAKEGVESITKNLDDATKAPKRGKNLLTGLVEMKFNGLEPQEGLQEIFNELKKNTPGGVSYEKQQRATDAASSKFSEELDRTSYLAQYEQQYQKGTGEISAEIIVRLDALQKAINNTFPFLKATASCAKGILDKTCS